MTAAITNATGSIRWSFLFLLAFFFVPLFIFGSMDVAKGKDQAKAFTAKENRHSVQHL